MNGIIFNYNEITEFISKVANLEQEMEYKDKDKDNMNVNIVNDDKNNNKLNFKDKETNKITNRNENVIKIESLDLSQLNKQTEKILGFKNNIKELMEIEKKNHDINVEMLDSICHQQMETRKILDSLTES